MSGIYASCCCASSAFSCALFEELPSLGGQCSAFYPNKKVYGVPGFPDIKAFELIDLLNKQVFSTPSSVPIVINERITSIKQSGEFCTLNNEQYIAKYIIIATGIGNMQPSIPHNISGIDNDFVHFYPTKMDLYKDRDIIVAGGGDSAVDFAICVKSIAKSVTIIHRKDKLRCDSHKINMLDGIDVRLSHSILSIERDHRIITDKADFVADYIVFCYGFRVETGTIDGLSDFGVCFDGGLISVDISTMQTGSDRIFAIGDAITYVNKKKNLVSCFFEADKAVRTIKSMES